MAKPLIPDVLWQRLQPLLPPPKPRRFRFPGRRPLDLRRVLTGILFVLRTGIAWEQLPKEMGCGCGVSCLNYLRAWHKSGTWQKLRKVLQSRLVHADQIDWARADRDAYPLRVRLSRTEAGTSSSRRRLGSKRYATEVA